MKVHYYLDSQDADARQETIVPAVWVDGFAPKNGSGEIVFLHQNGEEVTIPFENFVSVTADKSDAIKKALTDWRPELDHIIDKLGTSELLAQLAEEASELSKAALKLRRALDGKNPTPVSPADALLNLQEEMADVLLCMVAVGLDEDSTEKTIRAKIPRWSGRIDHDPDSDCPSF